MTVEFVSLSPAFPYVILALSFAEIPVRFSHVRGGISVAIRKALPAPGSLSLPVGPASGEWQKSRDVILNRFAAVSGRTRTVAETSSRTRSSVPSHAFWEPACSR